VRRRGDDRVVDSRIYLHARMLMDWFVYPAERPHEHSASAHAICLLRFDNIQGRVWFVPPKGRHEPHSASALTSPHEIIEKCSLQE